MYAQNLASDLSKIGKYVAEMGGGGKKPGPPLYLCWHLMCRNQWIKLVAADPAAVEPFWSVMKGKIF